MDVKLTPPLPTLSKSHWTINIVSFRSQFGSNCKLVYFDIIIMSTRRYG